MPRTCYGTPMTPLDEFSLPAAPQSDPVFGQYGCLWQAWQALVHRKGNTHKARDCPPGHPCTTTWNLPAGVLIVTPSVYGTHNSSTLSAMKTRHTNAPWRSYARQKDAEER